jgi:uncharacterized repeat protein (TIGR01451 family)
MMPRNRLIGILAVICATVAPTLGAASAAAAPGTAWQIKQGADPTVLVPGTMETAQYHALITNVGGEAASSGVTVTDTVSAGAKPVTGSSSMPNGAPVAAVRLRRLGEKASFPCAISGQTVTCEIVGRAVEPGEQVDVFVPVAVEAHPPQTVTNEVSVSSPGVASAFNALSSRTGVALPPFSFVEGPLGSSGSSFDEAGGTPPSGAHPFDVELAASVSTAEVDAGIKARDPLRSLHLEMPAGLDANPLAVKERCTLAELQEGVEENSTGCPAASQVGSVHFAILGGANQEHLTSPLIDMVPPPGAPAELAFTIAGTVAHIRGALAGNFHITAGADELITKFPLASFKIDLWGIPSDSRHDLQRGGEGIESQCGNGKPCSIEPSPAPFLTMPTSCTEPMELGTFATGWLGGATDGSALFEDLDGDPVTPAGCNQLAFGPTIESKATTNAAESPSGLEFKIHQPQEESLGGRATSALKDATVTLPEGMSLNPSAANGLVACTEQQMGYAPEEGKIRFRTTPQTCPPAAKVGTLEVASPLVEGAQPGQIFVAKPFDNPFGSLLAIYLAVEDEETGIVAKLAGKVEPDPTTGRLKATFTENPELPLNEIDLEFFKTSSGAPGVLTTPLTCGTKTTTTTLTPWSTPEGADAHPTSTFETSVGCSSSEAQAPKTMSFTAGTVSPLSGAYSPFVLRLARPDGSQHITGVETTLPEGLIGKLAGVAYCPESGIAQARSREVPEKGKEEIDSPSCPASSGVGTVNVTAGSGSSPIPVSGHAYLAGPYKGAPLSLVVIVPAVAGPFDLGTVVDRVALNVDPTTAQIRAVADPLPAIREGIPLDARSIEIKLDRPSFTLNPTSCEPKAIEGQVTTQANQTAPLKNRFQVGECGRLKFKPKLALSLRGSTQRAKNPALKAVLTQPAGQANIAKVSVVLPKSEFIDNRHIGTPCTRVQFDAGAGNGARCPAKSILGRAKAWTPLLDKPLEGPVYFRSNGGERELPDLVASLGGQVHLNVVGFIDSVHKKGQEVSRTRNTFSAVPDAPVSKFVLELSGGKKGLLQNSANLCKVKNVATVKLSAQNGKTADLSAPIANDCKAKGKKKSGKGKGQKQHGKNKAKKTSLLRGLGAGW